MIFLVQSVAGSGEDVPRPPARSALDQSPVPDERAEMPLQGVPVRAGQGDHLTDYDTAMIAGVIEDALR